MATVRSRKSSRRGASEQGAVRGDLLPVAEAALADIAHELCQIVRGKQLTRTKIAPDALWFASVARLLRIWLTKTSRTSEAIFFAADRCGKLDQRVDSWWKQTLPDTPALADWRLATESVGHSAGETHAIAQLFEQLQERRWEFAETDPMPRLVFDRGNRRAAGSYFTPAPLIDFIVRATVGAAWREHWAKQARRGFVAAGAASYASQVLAALATFRLVDPACGGGDFLLGALDFLQSAAETLLAGVPVPRVLSELVEVLPSCGFSRAATRLRDHRQLLRWLIAAQCLYGVDLDPLAVELTRARIWLALELPPPDSDWSDANIRHGNALVDHACEVGDARPVFDWRNAFPQVFAVDTMQEAGGFQAIIGNPPYGAIREPQLRKSLARRWPQMRHNSDAVVGFVSRADEISASDGHLGLVVPKPLTYSYAWRQLRESLYGRLDYCLDVSRAWPEVLLEQVLLGWRPTANRSEMYRGGEFVAGKFRNLHRARQDESRRSGAILCSLRKVERRLLASLARDNRSVGDLCHTFRGMPLQRELSVTGAIPVLGGRDLARWRLRSTSGYLAAKSGVDLVPFRREKLVFQNIVAHIMRPTPHIRLIGAFDASGQVTLDTVNNLVPREQPMDLHAVLALLHSRLVNWFVSAVVYNKAIRTMHFDQYFLNKIPLPAAWTEVAPALAELAIEAERATRAGDATAQRDAERKIDRQVIRAYGVPTGLVDEVI